MPLRPVSELGLVDLTDLALPDEAPAPRRASGSTKSTPRRNPKRTAGQTRKITPSKRQTTSKARKRQTTSKTRTPPAPKPQRRRSQVGVKALTGAIALAGGLVVGRAAAQR
jgi:hypothetical protein